MSEASSPAVGVAQADATIEAVTAGSLDEIGTEIARGWTRGDGAWIASEQLGWLVERLGLKTRTPEGLPLVYFGPARRSGFDRGLSRGLELLLVAAVFLAGAPLWLLVALLIKLSDRGSVFYRSKRSGLGGAPFDFLKFRSLRQCTCRGECACDSDRKRIRQDTIRSGSFEPANDDPDRGATPVGRLLRRSGLDEVPQFLHVLTGTMALVGPRPYPLYETEALKPWHRNRLRGKPGITGLWQVYCYHSVSFDQSVILDLYYLSNATAWLDLKLILLTPLRMLSGLKKEW
ncbi:MAG: sugar transferase [Myxococcales bacterium]